MRTRTALAGLLAAGALTLTACSSSSGSDGTDAAAKPTGTSTTKPAGKKAVDCSDQSLSQADWEANCDKQASKLHQQFGGTYTWADGVKVTVTEAKVFTAYDKSLDEGPTAGSTDYQVMVKVTNGGRTPLDLSNLSVISEGATNGGEAMILPVNNAAPGLEGRLAPGVTVIKADAESLGTKFGRKIVVTVQRTGTDNISLMDSPEFTGSITN